MVDIGQQAGGGGPTNKFVSGIRPPSPLDLQSGKVKKLEPMEAAVEELCNYFEPRLATPKIPDRDVLEFARNGNFACI